MSIRFMQVRSALLFAVVLPGLEGLGIALVQPNLAGLWCIIFGAILLTQLCQLIVSLWRARKTVRLQRQWVLLSISFFLQTTTYALRAHGAWINRVVERNTHWEIGYREVFMTFSYVPILLLFSIPSGRPYRKMFFWIDAAQAVIAGYLGYVKLFSVIPFTNTPTVPLSHVRITNFYGTADVVIAMLSMFRWFASTDEDEQRFHRTLCWYLWSVVVLHYAYGMGSTLWIEPLILIPALVFYILVAAMPLESPVELPLRSGNVMTALLNTVSPVFFTSALLALGMDVAPQYLHFGLGTILAAFVLYGLRATILQNSYEQSQRSLMEARDKLEDLSLKDALTGIANRRCFDKVLELEWHRVVRAGSQLSLLLIDVDYFKMLNDRYGHPAGDDCLVQIATALNSALPRNNDHIARYGGEEFAAILPDTDQDGARTVAVRMQASVHALKIENETSLGPFATISVGISTYISPQQGSPGLLLEVSDRALYQAKQLGRNRIELLMLSAFSDGSPGNA